MKKRIVLTFAGIISLALLFSGFALLPSSEKIAYIENGRLFSEFKMKIEMENELKKTELKRKVSLDSAKVILQNYGMQISANKNPGLEELKRYDQMRKHYENMEEVFYNQNEETATEYNNQIWTQLNQLIKEFAIENGIDILLGTTGQGSLMYAEKKFDATDAAILIVNE